MPKTLPPHSPLRVAVLIGTRPEAVKLAPVILALRARPGAFCVSVAQSGQHDAICGEMLGVFGLAADDVMASRAASRTRARPLSLAECSGRLMSAVGKWLQARKPDILLVQGDTATAAFGAQAAFLNGVPVGHVEAGLRSHDLAHPFPEEANRRIVGLVAALHFAPTRSAASALRAEAVPAGRIVVTGNTGIDALNLMRASLPAGLPDASEIGPLAAFDPARERLVLVTMHRRENWGAPVERVCAAIRQLAADFPDARFAFPLHPNPELAACIRAALSDVASVALLPPLGYPAILRLLRASCLLLTDSGGMQEEAPSFGVPAILLRERTERTESLALGISSLAGTSAARILSLARARLCVGDKGNRKDFYPNPYGDGRAAWRIALALERWTAAGRALPHETSRPLLGRREQFGRRADEPDIAQARAGRA